MTDEVWKRYIEDQKPEQPDDSFKVVWVYRTKGPIDPAFSCNPKPPHLGGGVFTSPIKAVATSVLPQVKAAFE